MIHLVEKISFFHQNFAYFDDCSVATEMLFYLNLNLTRQSHLSFLIIWPHCALSTLNRSLTLITPKLFWRPIGLLREPLRSPAVDPLVSLYSPNQCYTSMWQRSQTLRNKKKTLFFNFFQESWTHTGSASFSVIMRRL